MTGILFLFLPWLIIFMISFFVISVVKAMAYKKQEREQAARTQSSPWNNDLFIAAVIPTTVYIIYFIKATFFTDSIIN